MQTRPHLINRLSSTSMNSMPIGTAPAQVTRSQGTWSSPYSKDIRNLEPSGNVLSTRSYCDMASNQQHVNEDYTRARMMDTRCSSPARWTTLPLGATVFNRFGNLSTSSVWKIRLISGTFMQELLFHTSLDCVV
jgi:hypothetical protein